MSNMKKLSNRDLFNAYAYWMMFALAAQNMERMEAPAFAGMMGKAADKLYEDPEEQKALMLRHTQFYNTQPMVGVMINGIALGMEEQRACGENVPDELISSTKTALMGPLSGIGDSIYWGIVRCIAAGVGIGFAASGSILGPILFLVIYNLPGMLGRYYLTFLGFSMGENFITKAYESGMITILTKCAGIIGLMMVGFMISSNVSLSLALTMPVSGAEPIAVQPYLDSLLMGVLPLSLTMLCYWALKKKMNQNTLLFVVLGVGFVLGLLGIC